MKTLFIIILSCFLSAAVAQEEESYFILHVKGDIENTSTGSFLKSKDKINAGDKLKFKSHDAVAAVMSPSKGRFYLKPSEKAQEIEGEWLVLLKDAMVPAIKQASTRSGSLLNRQDFINAFANKKTIISKNTRILIPATAFPQSEHQFFYLQYIYNNEKINKRLHFDEEWMVMDKEDILKIDEVPIKSTATTNYTLFYFDAQKELSTELTTVTPVFISEWEIKAIIDALANIYKDEKKINEEMKEILEFMYGNVSIGTIEQWRASIK